MVPPPTFKADAPLKALVFDSHYDSYKGAVAYVRIVEGEMKADDILYAMSTKTTIKPVEIGYFSPTMLPTKLLGNAEVGYICYRTKKRFLNAASVIRLLWRNGLLLKNCRLSTR